MENYLKVAPYVLPENKATHASVLWPGDLHSQNIFVDPQGPGGITGIIDWQSVSAWPLFMQVGHPAFLDYEESKKQLDEGIKRFLDREAMDEDERKQWREALPFVA